MGRLKRFQIDRGQPKREYPRGILVPLRERNLREQERPSDNKASSGISAVKLVAYCWLYLLTGFVAGVHIYSTQTWPYPIIKEIENFIAGDPEEKIALSEKLENDLGLKPNRHIVTSVRIDETVQESRSLHRRESPNFRVYFQKYGKKLKELRGLPLKQHRVNPRMFLSDKAPKGYRIIYGVFDFLRTQHGAILLDPDGNIANVWQTSQEGVPWPHRKDTNVYPHGFGITPDGSIVTAYDHGSSLTKYDYCGNVVWRAKISPHHSISFDDDGNIWTWGDPQGELDGDWLMKVDYETGEVLKALHLLHVMESNPLIDIFGIIQDYNGDWIANAPAVFWHGNDIEPLRRALERHYPQFKAGDLLVSLRQPDLIFVMDPETLKVKWWRQGLVRRPHDPDWNFKGTITIFNNNRNRDYSSIVEIDPKTMNHKVVVDGEKFHFYSSIRGKHQLEQNGGYLITSSNQGRVFEVDPEGSVTFEFHNLYGFTDRNGNLDEKYLVVSEARFLPEDYFKELPVCD